MPQIDQKKIPKAIKDKYKLVNNSFRQLTKDNPKDRITVEVGDVKQPDTFFPQVKVSRWGTTEEDNEVNLSFRLKDDGVEPETVGTVADKIVWKKGRREAHFYDIQNAEHPEGAYEFEVVLLEKPATNVVEFSLNTKGLNFFYQPALTPEEISEGAERPENVVGSYAVYASEEKTNYVGGKEYKVGKVGHIFRPQIEDANGTKVWGELNVDTVNGVLSVTIPQEFLDKAVYPVRHAAGLTFGYSGTPSTQGNPTANYWRGTAGVPSGGNGNVDSVSLYCCVTSLSTDFKAVLTDSSLVIVNPYGVGGTVNVTNTSLSWQTMTYTNKPSVVNGSTYYVGFIANNSFARIGYDTPGGNQTKTDSSNSFTTPTDPTDATDSTTRFGIYATYTASGGGSSYTSIMMMGLGT